MASRTERPVTLSVLDRLIDLEPKQSGELPITRAESVRKFKDAVRRDLEWLLNTRQTIVAIEEGSPLEDSLLNYGLPDIGSFSVRNTQDRQRLIDSIRAAIERFEPRISNLKVSLAASGDEKLQVLSFVVEGALRTDPGAEYVTFNTVLDLSNREYKVQADANAR
jgi:type VI secretion system protein ImpF